MCNQFRGVLHWRACCILTTNKRLVQKALVLWWGMWEKEESERKKGKCLTHWGLESTTERCSNQWSLKRYLDAGEYRRKRASDTVIWRLSVTMEMIEQKSSENLSQFERVSVLRPGCASPCEQNQECEIRMTILARTWKIRTKAKDNFSFINNL